MDLFKSMENSLKVIADNTDSASVPLDVNIVTPVNAVTVLITSVDGGTP